MMSKSKGQVLAGQKPQLNIWQIAHMAFGFFGIQMAFALQNANASRIFETLGSDVSNLAIYWLAGPVTGLIVQPLVGHFSDNTWTRFGRRRPFFLAGAIWAAFALFLMPNAPQLWMAVASLWILDASINISMEPFRAFVGDKLPERQRTTGFAMQTFFIGIGGLLGSWLPAMLTWGGVSNEVVNGRVPDNVVYSFIIGALAILISVGWTVFSTSEYSPDELKAFDGDGENKTDNSDYVRAPDKAPAFFVKWGLIALVIGAGICAAVFSLGADKQLYVLGGGITILGALFNLNALLISKKPRDKNFFSEILDDLIAMPQIMKQLAIVQFFSWIGFFVMWIYSTTAVAGQYFGNADASSQAYQDAGDWVGIMFGIYNGVSALYAFLLPAIARKMGLRLTHAINLMIGGIGLVSYVLFSNPQALIFSMICIGIAWGSVLTMPYSILSNGIPALKMGIYMGIFNFFIVLPQLVVASIMGSILTKVLGGNTILIFVVGGVSFFIAAVSLLFVNSTRHKWDPDYSAKPLK